MNAKEKLAQIKNKIKENSTTIIATVSAGVAVGVTVAYAAKSSSLKKLQDENAGYIDSPHFFLSDEDIERLKEEDSAMLFKIDSDVFRVSYRGPEED